MNRQISSVYTLLIFRVSFFMVLLALLVRRNILPAALLLFLLIILEGARIWAGLGYRQVETSWRIKPMRLFPDEEALITITLVNRKRLPVLMYWKQELPRGLQVLTPERDEDRFLTGKVWLSGRASFSKEYRVTALKRGVYPWPATVMTAKDGLGLFGKEAKCSSDELVMIYPRLLATPIPELIPDDLIGRQAVRRPYLFDPIRVVGLREYTPDIPARFISWKASATKDKLLTRVLEPSADLRISIVLEMQSYLHPDQEDRLERVLSFIATVVSEADAKGIQTGLMANAALQGSGGPLVLPVRSGPNQVKEALELLARVEQQARGTLDHLLLVEGQRLPWGTTLMVIGTPALKHLPGPVRQVVYCSEY